MRLAQVLRVGVLGLLVVLAFGLVLAGGGSPGTLRSGLQPVLGKGVGTASLQVAGELIGVDRFGTFVKIEPNTAKSIVLGQATNIPDIPTDLAFAPDGTLYAVTWDTLWRIDLENNEATAISPRGFCVNADKVNALTVRKDGTLFAAMRDEAKLLTIDAATGCATIVGSTGFFSSGDLDFAPDGKLYAAGQSRIDQRSSALYLVDPDSGTSTRIGWIGFGRVYGLAFFTNGTLYGATEGNKLLRIDPSTGFGEEIGTITEVSGIWGLATKVMEP
jgi:hypothetical protein